jgi:hypothetical protein
VQGSGQMLTLYLLDSVVGDLEGHFTRLNSLKLQELTFDES